MNEQEEGDEVVRELDVYLNESNNDFYVLQFPLKHSYSDCPKIHSAKFRPKHQRLELSIPYPEEIFASDSEKPRPAAGQGQTLSSTTVTQKSNLCVGVIMDGSLHMSNLKEVLQCRPSFKGFESNIEMVEEDDDIIDSEPDEVADSKQLQSVGYKRQESERAQASRLQSYSHIQAQEDLEAWRSLKVHHPNSEEVNNLFETMYYSPDNC